MTTLTNLNINGVDCKAAVLSFDITKTIDGLPNIFSGKFARLALDALNVPALQHTLSVYYTCADATAEYEFYGKVTKVNPSGGFYEIEAQSLSKTLLEQVFTCAYDTVTCDSIAQAVAESGTGMSFSSVGGGTTGNYANKFTAYKQQNHALLRWLCLLSQNGANAPWVFYQSGRDNTTFCWDKFGRNDTGITLAVGTHVTEPMTWQKDENQIVNTVTVNYAKGKYTATDAGSVSTYGTRNMTINRMEVTTSADATLIANQVIFYFKAPLELIKASVSHDSLFSGTHYHVLNQKYTLTDATVGKTSVGPYTCIKHILHYPSFIDELTFGMPYTSTQSLLADITAALAWLHGGSFYNRTSNTLRHSLDAEASTASTTYVSLKTITFSGGLSAWFRTKFDLKVSNGSYIAYGRIYKNGVAIGTEQATSTIAYENYTQDLGHFLEPGDTLELWGHAQVGSGATAYVRNFRIYYDTGTVQAPPSTGDTIPGPGNVTGPTNSTDNALPRFDGTGGAILQDSAVTVADTTGAISIAGHLAITDPTASPAGKVLQDDGAWHTLAGGGNVSNAGAGTDNAIARFDGGGTTIQNSVVTVDDTTGLIKINAHSAVSDPTGSPTGKFLRDDGTWQTVSGSFDPTNATTITPATDDTYDLGTSAKAWRIIYLGSVAQIRSASTIKFATIAAAYQTIDTLSLKIGGTEVVSSSGIVAAAALPTPGAATKGGVALPATPTGTFYKDNNTWAACVSNPCTVQLEISAGSSPLKLSGGTDAKILVTEATYGLQLRNSADSAFAPLNCGAIAANNTVPHASNNYSLGDSTYAWSTIYLGSASQVRSDSTIKFATVAAAYQTIDALSLKIGGTEIISSSGIVAAAALPTPGASTKGGVALPGSSTGTFYRDDNTWAGAATNPSTVQLVISVAATPLALTGATDAKVLVTNATGLWIRNAGNSADAPIRCSTATVTGNITPGVDNNYSLGDETYAFTSLYLKTSLVMGGTSVLSSARVLSNVTADTGILTSGTLGVGRGGTGTATWTQGNIPYSSSGTTTALTAITNPTVTGTALCANNVTAGSISYQWSAVLANPCTTSLTISAASQPLKLTGGTDAKILVTEATSGLQVRNAADTAFAPLNCGACATNAVIPHVGNTYELGAASLGWSGLRLGAATANILVNDANAKRSLILTAAGGWPSTTSGCGAPAKTEYATNKQNLYRMSFVAGSASYAEWTVAMPANWDGSTVTAVFYWMQPGTTNQNIVWGIAGRSYADAELVDQAWGSSATVTDDSSATANQVRISGATAACTIGGTPAGGELVQLRIFRYGTGSDTLTQTAQLIAVKIQYGINAYSDA